MNAVNVHVRIVLFHKGGAEQSKFRKEHAVATSSSFFLLLVTHRVRNGTKRRGLDVITCTAPMRLCSRFTAVNFDVRNNTID